MSKRWVADGVDLKGRAWNIKTKGGSKNTGPAKRGENQLIPHRPGRRRVPKYRDSRIITLEMWVEGSETDGSYPLDQTMASQFDDNWAFLCRILQQEDEYPLQHTVVQNGVEVLATGMVEWISGMELEMSGDSLGNFEVELLMADPWFYGPPITVAASAGTFFVYGEHMTDKVSLNTVGRVTTSSPHGDRWVENTIGGAADIDCREHSAKVGSTWINGAIDRDRFDPTWMPLYPGDRNISGQGSLTYYPAYR